MVCSPNADPSCCLSGPGNGWSSLCVSEACSLCMPPTDQCPGTPCAPRGRAGLHRCYHADGVSTAPREAVWSVRLRASAS
jgi:hypothetical protein